MKKKKPMKAHELIVIAIIQIIIALTLLFNGFTYLSSLFLKDGEIVDGPTKQKGLLALFSMLEQSWWKYLVILIFGGIGYLMIKEARQKLNKRD